MRLYIWEGNGISTGYHDDGTLVVLAEGPEQAREIAIRTAKEWASRPDGPETHWTDGFESEGIYGDWERGHHNPAIDREPDRTVDLGEPQVVAWNGGGYD